MEMAAPPAMGSCASRPPVRVMDPPSRRWLTAIRARFTCPMSFPARLTWKSASASWARGRKAAWPAQHTTASTPVTSPKSFRIDAGSAMSALTGPCRDTPITSCLAANASTTALPMTPLAPITRIFTEASSAPSAPAGRQSNPHPVRSPWKPVPTVRAPKGERRPGPRPGRPGTARPRGYPRRGEPWGGIHSGYSPGRPLPSPWVTGAVENPTDRPPSRPPVIDCRSQSGPCARTPGSMRVPRIHYEARHGAGWYDAFVGTAAAGRGATVRRMTQGGGGPIPPDGRRCGLQGARCISDPRRSAELLPWAGRAGRGPLVRAVAAALQASPRGADAGGGN